MHYYYLLQLLYTLNDNRRQQTGSQLSVTIYLRYDIEEKKLNIDNLLVS